MAVVPSAGSVGIVAAVADGHGGERYVRSDVGARIAVEVATELGGAALSTRSGRPFKGRSVISLASEIVDEWQHRVLTDLDLQCFTSDEEARAASSLRENPLVSYGTTLLMALATRDEVALLQIGDGDITVVGVSGDVTQPVPGDDRLVAGVTTSLCRPSAVADARCAVLVASEVDIVLLSTDGYGNSFADEGWWQTVGSDLQRFSKTHGPAVLADQLPSWLAESAGIGGDDATAALVLRPDGSGA